MAVGSQARVEYGPFGTVVYDTAGKAVLSIGDGRASGKNAWYDAERKHMEQFFAPEQIEDWGKAVAYYAGPRNCDVDATFENEFTMNRDAWPRQCEGTVRPRWAE